MLLILQEYYPSLINNRKLMKLNVGGLPTPWPISMISVITSIVSIFLFEIEKLSFSRFAKLTLGYNIFRPAVSLIGSWNSLRVQGIKDFEYPSLTLLTSLTLPTLMFAIKRGIERLEGERRTLSENSVGENTHQSELTERTTNENLSELKKIYSLHYLCWGIVIISTLWQIFFSVVNWNNFSPSQAQFLTNCTVDSSVYSGIISTNNTKLLCKGDGNCLLTDKRLITVDKVERIAGLIGTLFVFLYYKRL